MTLFSNASSLLVAGLLLPQFSCGSELGGGGGQEPDGSSNPDASSANPDAASTNPDAGMDPENSNKACYPGLSGDGTTCLELTEIEPYSYPAGTGNYSTPIRFLDIDAVNLDTMLSGNFRLGEICVRSKGQYQVAQPHAIIKLQQLREMAGHALVVNSGFRSPTYNASIGGAAKSRHMYGDAFDVMPGATGRDALMQMCRDLGAGYVAKYDNSSHIHCDWRDDAVDENFFGIVSNLLFGDAPFTVDDLKAEILLEDGIYSVAASGYDKSEGQLARDWIAYNAQGKVIAEVEAMTFSAPSGTHSIKVSVGGLVDLTLEVSRPTETDLR